VPAEDVGGAVFTECAGEGLAELLVVVLEPADAVGGGVQAQQREASQRDVPESESRSACRRSYCDFA
jgi:hypothetical protein